MKKFLVYIIIFFASVVVIDQLVGIAGDYMVHHSKPSPNKQFDDLCLKDKHDVLIMGSSRARHHYVPQILEDSLGLDVYNAGYDGNGIILAYGILQMINERYSPKCILYDIEPAFDIEIYEPDDNRTRYLANLMRYYQHKGVSEVLKDVSRETYIKSHSGICRYNSDLINTFIFYIRGGVTYEEGYHPMYGEMKEGYELDESRLRKDNVKIEYLHKFIMYCKDNDIQIILALSPKFGVKGDEVQDIVNKLGMYYNVPVIDYYNNSYFQNNISLFKDYMHLNDTGARIFTKSITSELYDFLAN